LAVSDGSKHRSIVVMIVFAQCTYDERRFQTENCIHSVAPFVDRIIIIYDELPSDYIRKLEKQHSKLEFHQRDWIDDFPYYRNQYLQLLEDEDWVLWSDPDEIFDKITLSNLKRITDEGEKKGFDAVKFNSVDVTLKSLNATISPLIAVERSASWFKLLLMKYYKGKTRFTGFKVHEGIEGYKKAVFAPREMCYYHLKTDLDIIERGARNFHIVGGGANLGDMNPYFVQYKKILTDCEGKHLSWKEMRSKLRKGELKHELIEFLKQIKDVDGFDGASEVRQLFWYYKLLHPEQLVGVESRFAPI